MLLPPQPRSNLTGSNFSRIRRSEERARSHFSEIPRQGAPPPLRISSLYFPEKWRSDILTQPRCQRVSTHNSTHPSDEGIRMASKYLRKCPSCGGLIHPDKVPYRQSKGFPCPYCGVRLYDALWHEKLAWLLSTATALVVPWSLGCRTWYWIVIALILGTPALFVLVQAIAVFTDPAGGGYRSFAALVRRPVADPSRRAAPRTRPSLFS